MLRTGAVVFFGVVVFCFSVIDGQFCNLSGRNQNGILEKCDNSSKSTFEPFQIDSERFFLPHANSNVNLKQKWNLYFENVLTIMKNSANISTKCRVEYDKFLDGIDKNDIKSLKMIDATAKWPPGILNGNVNQYGDYDECMELENAQYCLTELDISSLWTDPLAKYKNLVHSHFMIQETFQDPKHRVPGFTMLRLGICIPKSCSNEDLKNALAEKLGVSARIPPAMCQTSSKIEPEKSTGYYFALLFFSVILGFVGISTIFHDKLEEKDNKLSQLLLSFSLQKNYKELTTVQEENEKEIKALHGIRALSALALLMGHKSMALLYNPYINRTPMTEILSMKWSVIGRNAIIFTDCFMLISGILNANAFFSDYDKNNQMRVREKIINRIFRILPNLLAVILFCTYILPSMGSGPLWPLVINHHSELCKQSMWRNLLFIHNYFGFENMCLTHTHQVAIDMQLFLATPIFVFIIWKFKKQGLYAIGSLAMLSTVLRFWATYTHGLSHFIHFGITISRMFDTANFSYILPTHRATIYLMGVILAYVLRYTTKEAVFSKPQLFIAWTLLYIFGFGTWLGPMHMAVKGFEYDRLQASIYGSVYPIIWGLAVGWIIYATNRGFGNWMSDILTWKHFQRFTKIGYAFYLVQFPVFFYNVGITRHAAEYKSRFLLEIVETGCIVIISAVLTLLVEMPFQNIRKVFSDNRNKIGKRVNSYKKSQEGKRVEN